MLVTALSTRASSQFTSVGLVVCMCVYHFGFNFGLEPYTFLTAGLIL